MQFGPTVLHAIKNATQEKRLINVFATPALGALSWLNYGNYYKDTGFKYIYIEIFQNIWSVLIRKVLNDVESERLDN